jgi:hypothetical protein
MFRGGFIMKFRSHNRKFLKDWNARMTTDITKPLVDKVVVAILKHSGVDDLPYEPRNLYQLDALYQILEYYEPEESPYVDLGDVRVRKGLDFAYKHFAKPVGVPTLSAHHLEHNLSELFITLDIKGRTSAGLTDYGKSKAEAWPVGVRKAKETLLKTRKPEPCLAGARTQAGKLGRLVWMYPLSMTIIEALVARPLIEMQKRGRTPMAFGQKSTVLGTRIRKAQTFNGYYSSLDSSQFDATIGKVVIQAAFNAFRTWFNLEDEVLEGITVGDVFDVIENYFIYTDIVMPHPDGPRLYTGKRHGVPSGSYFTQMVDSFASTCLIGTLDYTYKLHVQGDEFWVLGDDMLFFTRQKPEVGKWSELLSNLYGMKVNAKKSSCGRAHEVIHFLGRDWHNGIPFREWNDVLERAISPERYRKYGSDLGKGAALVLASYGSTALYRNKPNCFNPWFGLVGSRFVMEHASGLTQFYLREGILTNLVTRSLH